MPLVQVHSPQGPQPQIVPPARPRPKSFRDLVRRGSAVFRNRSSDALKSGTPPSKRVFSLHEIKTRKTHDEIAAQVRTLFSKEQYLEKPNEYIVNLLVILDQTKNDENISLSYCLEIMRSMQAFYNELEDKDTFIKKIAKLVDHPQVMPLIRVLLLWKSYRFDDRFWETFFEIILSKEKELFFDFFSTMVEYETNHSFYENFYPHVSFLLLEKALLRFSPVKAATSMNDLCSFVESLKEEQHFCLLKKWSEHTSVDSARDCIIHFIQNVCVKDELAIHAIKILTQDEQITKMEEQRLLSSVSEIIDLLS